MSTPAQSADPPAPRRIAPLEIAALAAPIAMIGIAGAARRWMSDDGYINARVVEQILAGHGPVFNAGERVEVTTSTLWLWLMVLGRVLTGGAEVGISATWLGIALTVAGFAFATLAALELGRGRGGIALPFGTPVLAALPPMWDFASSGLETGLGFCWIGLCTWLLARRCDRDPPAWRPVILPLVIGLGPLVRPDFALYSLAFAVALLCLSRRSVSSWLGAAAIALALPLAYQVFRAGYYGALVPNTAIAKDAGGSDWSAGALYLLDLYGTYGLVIPLAAAVVMFVRRRPIDRRVFIVAAAPVLAGLLQTVYVVRVGGDFMHGRMLLPGLFAMLAPVAVLRLPARPRAWRSAAAVAVGVATAWLLVVAPAVRPAYAGGFSGAGIADERGYWSGVNGVDGPVTAADWARWGAPGTQVRLDHAAGRYYYKPHAADPAAPTYPAHRPGQTAITEYTIGIIGYAAGTADGALVIDRLSLADPVAARMAVGREGGTSRPGHTQEAPEPWRLARYADTAAAEPRLAAAVADARAALGCGALAELVAATTAPLDWSRFWANVAAAPRLTALTVPPEPAAARAALCGG